MRALLTPATRSPAVGARSSGTSLPISRQLPPGVRSFLRVETSTPVFNVLYRYGRVDSTPDGAYGPNVTAPASRWYLEYQRAGATDVIDGVLRHDNSLVAAGLRIFYFGLARERTDGSFPGSMWPFHGTAMFLAEAAPALIVLKYSPLRSTFDGELRWQTDRMQRAARRMVQVVGGPGKIDDRTKNHRFFEAALALEATGVLASDRQLQSWSTRYAWQGIHMQRQDGVMPEDGGHDTGYQALGLTYATRYLDLVTPGALHNALYSKVERGEAWELSRIRSDGTVKQSGDTRTTGCQERDPTGHCKSTFYAPIFSALARWAVISGDGRFERTAYRVWLQNWQLVPGDVLPRPGLWATPPQARHGDWLTVHGAGFQPLEVVRVYFDGSLQQTIPCDQIGSFGGHSPQPNAHFPLPDVAPGRHEITARGSMGTVRHAYVTVRD